MSPAKTMKHPVRRFNSIRARTTIAFSAAFATLLLVAGAALISYIRRDVEGDADRLLRSIGQRIRFEMLTEHVTDPDELISEEQSIFGDGLCLIIIDSGRKIVSRSSNNDMKWPVYSNNDWRVQTTVVDNRSIVVGMDWRKSRSTLRTQTTAILLFSLVIFLSASGGAWFLVGHTLSPIGRLSQQARAAAADAVGIRLSQPSQDEEIVELVSTLNSMLKSVEDSLAVRGRFYAAASHELRTPLQALSGHLELAAIRDRSNDEYRQAIAEANSQARRLINLCRDLLFLTQVEASAPPPLESICLAEVIGDCMRQIDPILEKRLIGVDWVDSAEIFLRTPATHIEMLVRNLVENAAKYASSGTRLQLSLTNNSSATFSLFNVCEPVEGWIPERTFEAFYRPDSSRNSATGGNGVGLAICKAICDRNGWKIDVCQVQGGVSAVVQFSGKEAGDVTAKS